MLKEEIHVFHFSYVLKQHGFMSWWSGFWQRVTMCATYRITTRCYNPARPLH